MKKAISLIVFLVIVSNLYSQKTTEFTPSRDYYLQKSKKQFTTGWILLGAGATMTVVGGIGFDKNFVMFEEHDDSMDKKADIYGFIMLAGLVMDIVSIPVLISASKNKKKAARIVISNQIIYQPQSNLMAFQKQTIPSLTLKITF